MQRWLSSLFVLAAALLCLAPAHAGPVNINTADAATLARELTGVGDVLAAEIVRDREMNGPFETPEALTRVKGVGPRIVEMNRTVILTSTSDSEA